ncbi:hypothetical protein RI543_001096 [Arxiozyma heterogenica]|uniref:Uncharacterized protein n=1 Tax=Arxiozyma heterogenica TaxID=278026 RepID=A0AAN8A7W1_9SACH|nr:hypothetical protein RI543_001096 [Kazachstania heterogenica]
MTPIRKYSHANIDLWFYDCGKRKFNSFLMKKNLLKHFVEKLNIKMIPFLNFRLQVRIALPLLINKDLNYGKLEKKPEGHNAVLLRESSIYNLQKLNQDAFQLHNDMTIFGVLYLSKSLSINIPAALVD